MARFLVALLALSCASVRPVPLREHGVKTAADYLAAIDAVRTGYLDALWSEAGGWYQDADGCPDSVANASIVLTTAIRAHLGVASATDKARACTVVANLIAAPAYNGSTWKSEMDGRGDVHPARDEPVSAGLYYAYLYRADLGLDAGVAASVLALLTSHRVFYESGDSLSVTAGAGSYSNQNLADWQFNVIAYAHLLGTDLSAQLSTSAKRFIDLIDGPRPPQADAVDPDTYLRADFGWWYMPTLTWNSWEYGAMDFGKFVLRYPELSAALGLTAGEIARVQAWSRHHLGQWQRNGYPNWDTSYSDWRLHSTAYWLWGVSALMGTVRATALNQGASDHLYAKWILDNAIDTWARMDTWRADPADGVPPPFPFGTVPQPWATYSLEQRNNTWGKLTCAAKWVSILAQSIDLGIADAASADPGNVWGWNWTDKTVYVSTPSYDAASLPYAPILDIWGAADGVQLQHWGVSRIAKPTGEILTATGGYGPEAFHFKLTRSGVTQFNTGDPAAAQPTQRVWRDGVEQTRTDYDTTVVPSTFAQSIRSLCVKAGPNYRAEVDTEFLPTHIRSTHRAVLTGAAGPAVAVMSIPARQNVVIDYVAVGGAKTVIWNGVTLTPAGSPAPSSCRYIHMKWDGFGAGLMLVPRSATLGAGAKVTALGTAPSGYPRRQPDQDRSLLVYLSDTTSQNVGDVEITHDYVLTDGTDAGAEAAYAALYLSIDVPAGAAPLEAGVPAIAAAGDALQITILDTVLGERAVTIETL